MLQGCLCQQFLSRAARLWNSLPTKRFPLTYDLNGFRSKVNRHLYAWVFSKQLPFVLFFLFSLVTSCLVVAVQSCMELIPIKKMRYMSITIREKNIICKDFFCKTKSLLIKFCAKTRED